MMTKVAKSYINGHGALSSCVVYILSVCVEYMWQVEFTTANFTLMTKRWAAEAPEYMLSVNSSHR